jgi:hypothetical protein
MCYTDVNNFRLSPVTPAATQNGLVSMSFHGIQFRDIKHLVDKRFLQHQAARVAQLLERRAQRSDDACVGGSNPTMGRGCRSFGRDL